MLRSDGASRVLTQCRVVAQGLSFGVADGVGGWSETGVDPSMFSQALMYHAHRYSKHAWAGEPETEPTQNEDDPVEGWELTPQECLDLAYGGVLRENDVMCGTLELLDCPGRVLGRLTW